MLKMHFIHVSLPWLILAFTAVVACAEVRLPALFSDGMVLQREREAPVWGWATPGEKVTVSVGAKSVSATAGADGRWQVRLASMKATGTPFDVTIAGATNTIALHNILVGEVWICSGQSNMEMGVGGVMNAAQEIAAANYPQIRQFTVAKVVADQPKTEMQGKWVACTPETVGSFSAVAYFFGRNLHQQLKVPIGLIHTSWSGTPAEAWASRDSLARDPKLRQILDHCFDSTEAYRTANAAFEQQLTRWQDAHRLNDPGNAGEKAGWAAPNTDTKSWYTMTLPVMLMHGEPSLYLQGAFWFRREVEIPAAWAGHALTLNLGPIADFDVTYFNGVQIGAHAEDTPETAKVSRQYTIPAEQVKTGRAVIAVRLFSKYGEGGFGAKPEEFSLTAADAQPAAIPLAGPWNYRVELGVAPKPTPRGPIPPDSSWSPTKLFNGMIAPLIPYAMRGAIWYQGESNGDLGYQYRTLFPAMISSWRAAWGEGDFPFLYVQLANWLHHQDVPSECSWAELRDAQLFTLHTRNTGMAVAIDIGDALDIHPKNKQEVGRRLALAAEAQVYKQPVAYSGPMYRTMKVEKAQIRLRFDHIDGGLLAKDGELTGFAIAGKDHRFVWAHARIDGETVVVWSEDVPAPEAVRYGWHYNPTCNLYNHAGLPASPFRTDTWPGLSDDVQ